MGIEFREILDDELGVATTILDAAYVPSAARAGRLRRDRSLAPTTSLLAFDDDEPVGVGGAIDYGAFAYIGLVGVAQHIQRHGIGRAIMDKLLADRQARQPDIASRCIGVGRTAVPKDGFRRGRHGQPVPR